MGDDYYRCWEERRDENDEGSACMLPVGHDGEHEFIPDSEIYITWMRPQ